MGARGLLDEYSEPRAVRGACHGDIRGCWGLHMTPLPSCPHLQQAAPRPWSHAAPRAPDGHDLLPCNGVRCCCSRGCWASGRGCDRLGCGFCEELPAVRDHHLRQAEDGCSYLSARRGATCAYPCVCASARSSAALIRGVLEPAGGTPTATRGGELKQVARGGIMGCV